MEVALSPQPAPPGQFAFVILHDDRLSLHNGARLIGDQVGEYGYVYAPATEYPLVGVATVAAGLVIVDANMHTHFARWKS